MILGEGGLEWDVIVEERVVKSLRKRKRKGKQGGE
jgi:hypothetical protein